jgi:hypothetical protein
MATADWSKMDRLYYRKRELYLMDWPADLDLSQYIVAPAHFAGPIAIVKNPNIPTLLRKDNVSSKLVIFSALGKPIASALWDYKVVKMGWTALEHLVCVLE